MKKKLTMKERKFIAAKVKGQTDLAAYKNAGYSILKNNNSMRVNANKVKKRPHISEAIDKALLFHEATPEFAVGRLKAIAEQEKELGASRLASKDILELNGWRKEERPQLQVSIKSAFFNSHRQQDNQVNQIETIEAE